MGIRQAARELFSRRSDEDEPGFWTTLYQAIRRTDSGEVVTEDSALRVASVYACVRILAEDIAALPFGVYRTTDSGKTRVKGPLDTLLHDMANPDMTAYSFRETMMLWLLLWGNAYARIERRSGYPVALWVLPADKVEVKRESSNARLTYHVKDATGNVTVLGAYEVLHIPGLSFDGMVGLSPIQYAAQAIGLALATERFGAQFFGNGATPSLALEHPGTVKDPKRLRENFRAAYGGRNNRGVAVLEEGMKVSVISVPPESAQFLESRKFQLTEICRIYRVPPHLVQHLENATFSNIEHQSIDYVQHTLVPWMVRWEQAVDARLLTDQERTDGLYVKLNANALVRGDFKSRMDGYAIGRQNGFLSTNDIRRLEDMDIVPEPDGGDAMLVNGNMITLKTAMEAKPANTKGGTANDGTGADEPQPADPATGEADSGDDTGVPGGG